MVFERYSKTWQALSSQLKIEKPEIFKIIEEGRAWLSRIIEITEGARIRDTPQVLIHEYSRIYSRTIRRFYAVSSFAENIFTDVVEDQLRSVTEMLFKTFLLLRSDNANALAIDARNLSAISWINAGDRAFSSGSIKRPDSYDEDIELQDARKALLERYKNRKPKFYADLSVSQVAEKAGLHHIYKLAYNWMSASAHNEPIAEPRSLSKGNYEEGVYIEIIPNKKNIDDYLGKLSLFIQTATIGSLASLMGFCTVDKGLADKLLSDLEIRYHNYGWAKEFETIKKMI